MKSRTASWIILISLIILFVGCGTSKNFLVYSFSQQINTDGSIYNILSGSVSFDELSPSQQDMMKNLNYNPGDLVPAVSINEILFLPKSSDVNTKKIDLDEWRNVGKYKTVLFDDMNDWLKRNKNDK